MSLSYQSLLADSSLNATRIVVEEMDARIGQFEAINTTQLSTNQLSIYNSSGLGKILTSDVNGNATWQAPPNVLETQLTGISNLTGGNVTASNTILQAIGIHENRLITAESTLNSATNLATNNTIVKRDSTGQFAGTNISASTSVSVGTGLTLRPTNMSFGLVVQNRILDFYNEDGANLNGSQFYGLGINPGVFRFQCPLSTNHVFYVGSNERMRINGSGVTATTFIGNLSGNATTATTANSANTATTANSATTADTALSASGLQLRAISNTPVNGQVLGYSSAAPFNLSWVTPSAGTTPSALTCVTLNASTSVTAPTFIGNLSGNATTATTATSADGLQTRAISNAPANGQILGYNSATPTQLSWVTPSAATIPPALTASTSVTSPELYTDYIYKTGTTSGFGTRLGFTTDGMILQGAIGGYAQFLLGGSGGGNEAGIRHETRPVSLRNANNTGTNNGEIQLRTSGLGSLPDFYVGSHTSGFSGNLVVTNNMTSSSITVNSIDMTPSTQTVTGNWFRVRTTINYSISFRRYGDLVFWSIPSCMDFNNPTNTVHNATSTFEYFEFTALIPTAFRPLASSNRSLTSVAVWSGADPFVQGSVHMISNGLIVVQTPSGRTFTAGALAGWHTTLQGSYRIV